MLVGTTSIENSEKLSEYLRAKNIEHQVLNAKHHEKEAEIIAQAGSPGVVTIATNMAGRGTDIVLGGNVKHIINKIREENLNDIDREKKIDDVLSDWRKQNQKVIEAGGLHIVGTERHESRRIDNQLRGRSGRQGDPGSSRFYLAMDDSLLRIFAGEKMKAIMDKLGVPRGEAIEAGMVSRSIESAQRKVENRNFDIRKQLLEFDNVANEQRKILYQQRNEVLDSSSLSELVSSLRRGTIQAIVRDYVPKESIEEQWDLASLEQELKKYSLEMNLKVMVDKKEELGEEDLLEEVCKKADEKYGEKLKIVGDSIFHSFEKAVILQTIDIGWREHLAALDHLRQGIHLRGYAQKDPKQEYKREAFQLFESFLESVRNEVTSILMNVEVEQAEQIAGEMQDNLENKKNANLKFDHPNQESESSEQTGNFKGPVGFQENCPFKAEDRKVGRNELCGLSGKKYKHCCGRLI